MVTVVISPKVKYVRNVRGFIPVMYALRYGMYIEPNINPAPRAQAIPRTALPWVAWEADAAEMRIAPANMMKPPPTTAILRIHAARCNSLNSRMPQRIPIRLLEFHK